MDSNDSSKGMTKMISKVNEMSNSLSLLASPPLATEGSEGSEGSEETLGGLPR